MASTSKPSSRAWRINLSLLTALSLYWRRLLSVRGGFGRRSYRRVAGSAGRRPRLSRRHRDLWLELGCHRPFGANAFLCGDTQRLSLTAMGIWVLGSTAYNVLVLGVPRAEIMGVIGTMALAAKVASVLLLMRQAQLGVLHSANSPTDSSHSAIG